MVINEYFVRFLKVCTKKLGILCVKTSRRLLDFPNER